MKHGRVKSELKTSNDHNCSGGDGDFDELQISSQVYKWNCKHRILVKIK